MQTVMFRNGITVFNFLITIQKKKKKKKNRKTRLKRIIDLEEIKAKLLLSIMFLN